jgi:rhamnose ABC transporter rhamnose-binding protein
VAFLAAATLVGACGGTGAGPEAEKKEGGGGGAANAEGPICVMPKLVGIPYFNASEQGAEEAAKELGVELNYTGPTEGKAALQVEMIEQLTQQGCAAITVAANDPDALAPAMRKAKEAGIATGAWDADVAKDARDVFVNQATFEGIGTALVDVMAKQTNERGEFLVVTGSLTAPNQNAWLKEMRAHMKAKYPDMSIKAVEPGEENLQKGLDLTKDYLRANPETAGVFGITSVALPGAAEAVEQIGKEGDIPVTGLAVPSDMKQYVEGGTVKEFVLWNPVDLGYLAVHVAAAQVKGEDPTAGKTFKAGRLGEVEVLAKDEILLGPPLVFDRENIDQYKF